LLTVNGTSQTIDAEMPIVEAEIAAFDATSVRIRRVPFSPDNVKSALSYARLPLPARGERE
jgi:hypothetical protein